MAGEVALAPQRRGGDRGVASDAVAVELGHHRRCKAVAAGVVAAGQNPFQHRWPGVDVAEAQTGGENLRQRAEIDLVGTVVQGVHRRLDGALVVNVSVAVVLDDRHAEATGELDQFQAALLGHDETGWVLVGGDGVDEFRGPASCLQAGQGGLHRV